MTRRFEVVVVGAGAVGLSVARALALRGRQVVVYEQATMGHGAGGSKGSARIFRLGYDHPAYVRLAVVAHRMWRRLEAESRTTLLTTTGQVTFGDDLDVLVDAMTEGGARHSVMTSPEVARRFPGLSVSTSAVFEPESGVISADGCLGALTHGARFDTQCGVQVSRCEDDGRRVRLHLETSGGTEHVEASVVVVCAGPATASLVSGPVGFHPLATLEQVAYLAEAEPGMVDRLPVFVDRRQPWFYGLPLRSSRLMKISLHGAGPAVSLGSLADFDSLDHDDPALVAELLSAARTVLPGFLPGLVATERCVYDNSPDGDFVLDRIGNIVIGSGTSGHGFKFAPLLGEFLARLATGEAHDESLGAADDWARFGSRRLRSVRPPGPTPHL